MWGVAPSEFWGMTPAEWWLIFDAKYGDTFTKTTGMHELLARAKAGEFD